jgi:peptidoglycan/xylan/chitin deacetylase (PgdA/CDA1 family)
VGAGHDVGRHGWVHDDNSLLDATTERDLMVRAHDVLTPLLGARLVGLRSGSVSAYDGDRR